MSDPRLYKFGIRDLYFNKRLYFKEVAMAIVQASAIMFFTFFSLCLWSINEDGQYGSLADGGDFIFALSVFLPSVKLVVDSY